MPNSAINVYRTGAQTYRSEVESWKQRHDEAIKCFDLEDLLATGVRIVDGLFMLDEKHRARVFAGEVVHDQESHQLFMAVYAMMAEAFEALLDRVVKCEGQFGTVKYADEMREHLSELKGILTPDDKFFGAGLVPLRDAALDANLGGDVLECRSWK